MTDTLSHKLADIAAPIMARLNVSVGDNHHFGSGDRWLIIQALNHYAEHLKDAALTSRNLKTAAGATVARMLVEEAVHCTDIGFVIDTSPRLAADRALTEAFDTP